MITGKVIGDKEIKKKLGIFPKKIENKVLRTAMKEANKPLKDKVQANAPVKTGRLKRSVKIKAAKRSRKRSVGVRVTIQKGNEGAWYGALVELGTKRIKGRHFEERAYKEEGEAVLERTLTLAKLGFKNVVI
jgi:HK97 gp10 family phage protein